MGLKSEMQGMVMAQLPATVDRVVFLAQVQQEILDKTRSMFGKTVLISKSGGVGRSE